MSRFGSRIGKGMGVCLLRQGWGGEVCVDPGSVGAFGSWVLTWADGVELGKASGIGLGDEAGFMTKGGVGSVGALLSLEAVLGLLTGKSQVTDWAPWRFFWSGIVCFVERLYTPLTAEVMAV